MDKQFLIVQEGALYSPAVVYLAFLLRGLKSAFHDKDSFVRHMSKRTDGMEFSNAEVLRIWDSLHNVTYYRDGADMTGLDSSHHLTFPRNAYTSDSNFFEHYANDIFNLGEIIKPRGRQKGFTSPAIKANLENMRAKKAAKKIEQTATGSDFDVDKVYPIGRTPSESNKSPFGEYSSEELLSELYRRGYRFTFWSPENGQI